MQLSQKIHDAAAPRRKVLTQEVVEDSHPKELTRLVYREEKGIYWQKVMVGLMALGLFIFGSFIIWKSRQATETQNSLPATEYTCPTSEYVDCMPGPGESKPQCEPAYLDWAQINCDGFKGAAY